MSNSSFPDSVVTLLHIFISFGVLFYWYSTVLIMAHGHADVAYSQIFYNVHDECSIYLQYVKQSAIAFQMFVRIHRRASRWDYLHGLEVPFRLHGTLVYS